VVETERYFATVVGGGRYVNATRLRFEPEDAPEVMAEVRALAPRGIGAWSTRRRELAAALVAAGGRDPEPPRLDSFTRLTVCRSRAIPSGQLPSDSVSRFSSLLPGRTRFQG